MRQTFEEWLFEYDDVTQETLGLPLEDVPVTVDRLRYDFDDGLTAHNAFLGWIARGRPQAGGEDR